MKIMDVEFDAKRDRAEIPDPSTVTFWAITTGVSFLVGTAIILVGPAFIALTFLLHPVK